MANLPTIRRKSISKITQADRVHEYLKEKGRITPFEAWNELGVSRLAARVFELREQGVEIVSTTLTVENRFGETCHVADYTLN